MTTGLRDTFPVLAPGPERGAGAQEGPVLKPEQGSVLMLTFPGTAGSVLAVSYLMD